MIELRKVARRFFSFTHGSQTAIFGLVWLSFAFLSNAAHAQSAKLIEDAKKEGEVVWYTSQLDDVGYAESRKIFFEKYGVKLTIIEGSSGGVYQRLAQDMQMGAARADVLS